jgi:hypothetical protein
MRAGSIAKKLRLPLRFGRGGRPTTSGDPADAADREPDQQGGEGVWRTSIWPSGPYHQDMPRP